MVHIILYVVITNTSFLLCGKLCVFYVYVYVSLEWRVSALSMFEIMHALLLLWYLFVVFLELVSLFN